HVDAVSLKDFTGFNASGAFGAVGVGGSVSVWSIGTTIEKTTTDKDGKTTDSALDGGGKSADDYAGEQVDVGSGAATGSSGKGGGFGNFASDGGSAKDSSNRVHGGTQKALTGFNASAPTQASIKSTENAD